MEQLSRWIRSINHPSFRVGNNAPVVHAFLTSTLIHRRHHHDSSQLQIFDYLPDLEVELKTITKLASLAASHLMEHQLYSNFIWFMVIDCWFRHAPGGASKRSLKRHLHCAPPRWGDQTTFIFIIQQLLCALHTYLPTMGGDLKLGFKACAFYADEYRLKPNAPRFIHFECVWNLLTLSWARLERHSWTGAVNCR